MTLPFDAYPWFAILSSLLILGLFMAHAADATVARHWFHDDRSAVDLLLALTLVVASAGLFVSASASFATMLSVTDRSELRNYGLGIVRGTLVVTACVLLWADRAVARRRV